MNKEKFEILCTCGGFGYIDEQNKKIECSNCHRKIKIRNLFAESGHFFRKREVE